MPQAAPEKITNRFRLAIGQCNPIVGDIDGNLSQARKAREAAALEDADLLVLSELFLCGYPPEDLVLKPAFQDACLTALQTLAQDTLDGGPGILIGAPLVIEGKKLANAVALLDGGTIQTMRAKVELPNYGVFDEKRLFAAGPLPGPINFRGLRIGAPICEDIWTSEVVDCLVETGAEILLVLNGSPYWRGKADERINIAVARVVESGLPLVYVNQCGGQDELVFDGGSFGLNADRTLGFQMPQFETAVTVIDYAREGEEAWRVVDGPLARLPDLLEADWRACVMGLKDYVEKNGFPGVVLGLSGGVDSALCAAMAVDALGAGRVHAVMLPYRFTSNESLEEAAKIAELLEVRYDILPIEAPVAGFESALAPLFAGMARGVAEENLQSRVRGTMLMAISNKFGEMVVTTGNKSEVSVGYATLYGDMNGGFNPVKDIYKTHLYRLARWRNANHPAGALGPDGPVMPENVLTRAPTAELRENQIDQDSLPSYEVLDQILECLVEKEMRLADILALGFDEAIVKKVERLLNLAEYKRRQAAPGVKITHKNFGRDRRYPITNRFRDPL